MCARARHQWFCSHACSRARALACQNMYTYVTSELPALVEATFGDKIIGGKKSISGHSMGGHGALTLALKNPTMYSSVSAFSPICHP